MTPEQLRMARWVAAKRAMDQKRANEYALGCIAALTRTTRGQSFNRDDTEAIRMLLAQAGWLS